MVFKRFDVNLILRTTFLCLSIFLLFYLLSYTHLIATTFILTVIIIIQIYSLLQFVKKTNREVARFFDSVRYSDFSQSFRTGLKDSSFPELSQAFTSVMDEFKKTRTEKEENYHYLQTIIQHINIGLISYKLNGDVDLINNSAKKLLGINSLKNVSELSTISKPLADSLQNIKTGEKKLIKFAHGNDLLQLSISAAEFKLKGELYTLVTFNNIQNELEEKEMEAWQNLIRVLTHEIMNSVTPIISLSSTASNIFDEKENHELSPEGKEDVKVALNTIARRSKGLLHFVDDYRNLTRIPSPNFQSLKILPLFQRIEKLFEDKLAERKINFSYSVIPQDLEVTADPDLIEQVIINLILNSLTAVSASLSPAVTLEGRIDNRSIAVIRIIDNGCGIPEELQEKIFIPFFTTNKEGSGIGLSLSRQIMRLHKGSITVNSAPDSETTFTLSF